MAAACSRRREAGSVPPEAREAIGVIAVDADVAQNVLVHLGKRGAGDLGIALLRQPPSPGGERERDLAEGRLIALFEEPPGDLGYYIATRPGVLRPPLRAFVAWLRRHDPRQVAAA